MDTPAGLVNLGNTCYMNATLQAIGCIEELRSELLKGNQSGGALVQPLAALTRSLESTSDGVNPMSFLTALRAANPQFAERDRSEKSAAMMNLGMGGYSQQGMSVFSGDGESRLCCCWVLHSISAAFGYRRTVLPRLIHACSTRRSVLAQREVLRAMLDPAYSLVPWRIRMPWKWQQLSCPNAVTNGLAPEVAPVSGEHLALCS